MPHESMDQHPLAKEHMLHPHFQNASNQEHFEYLQEELKTRSTPIANSDGSNGSGHGFYDLVLISLNRMKEAVSEAENVSRDYKPEARRERQEKLVDGALARFERDLLSLQRALEGLEVEAERETQAIVENAIAPPTETTDFGHLYLQLQQQEIRRIIMDIPKEDRTEAFLATAREGRADVYFAVANAPLPIVNPHALNAAKSHITERLAGEQQAKQKMVSAAAEAGRSVLFSANKTVQSSLNKLFGRRPLKKERHSKDSRRHQVA